VQGKVEVMVGATEYYTRLLEKEEASLRARLQQLQRELSAAAMINTELQQRNIAVDEACKRRLHAQGAELAAAVSDNTALKRTVRCLSCHQGCMMGWSRRACQQASVNSQRSTITSQQSAGSRQKAIVMSTCDVLLHHHMLRCPPLHCGRGVAPVQAAAVLHC
jgi:hypothetical protein